MTKFQLHSQFFAHATLLKAVPGFQYILNVIAVADKCGCGCGCKCL